MTWRSLLVLLGEDVRSQARIEVAIELARQHQAHLVGLAPTGVVELPMISDPSGPVGDLAALTWSSLRAQAERAAEQFRIACTRAELPSFEAVVDEAEIGASVVRHAHCSDMCIVSQADPAAGDKRSTRRIVEQIVLHGARPTLLVPANGHRLPIGTRALVAWDDSREAARAVADALPMLRLAGAVEVVNWSESMLDEPTQIMQRLESLQRWLMWQGVSAEVRSESSEMAITEAICARAAASRVDLIVMGAYGHSRWTERMLGGATRGLLEAMAVPVLMSH